MQLPFAIFPLVQFTSSPKFMGEFVLPVWQRILAWLIFFLVTGLNIKLVYDFCSGACWLCRLACALPFTHALLLSGNTTGAGFR